MPSSAILGKAATAFLLDGLREEIPIDRVLEIDNVTFDFTSVGTGGLALFGDALAHIPTYQAVEIVTKAMERFDIGVLSIPLGHHWYSDDIGRRFAATLAAVVERDSMAVTFFGRTDELRAALATRIDAFEEALARDPDGLLRERNRPPSDEFIQQFTQIARFLEIASLADAGCGDFAWMEKVSEQFPLYFGLDRDAAQIADLDQRFGSRRGHYFAVRDIATDPLPKVDAVLCRDLFQAHSVDTVSAMLTQIKASGAKYLLANTTPGAAAPADLSKPPFSLPLPFLQFSEEAGGSKLLGVWRIPQPVID